MAMSKYESVWKLLKEHNFDMYVADSSEYHCIICKSILKNARQSPCGCRYCLECIMDYLGEEPKYCPGETDDCKEQLIDSESDLQIDYVTNKHISQIAVKCPKSFCFYTTKLRNIEEHLNSHTEKCPYHTLGCTNSGAFVESLNTHLNDDIYDHSVMLTESIKNLSEKLSSLKKSQRELKNLSEKENEILDDLEQQTDELCNWQNEQRNHFKKDKDGPDVPQFVIRQRLQELETSKNKNSSIPSICNMTSKKYFELGLRRREYLSNSSLTEDSGSTVRTAKGWSFIWHIRNFRHKMEAARFGKGICLTSDSFYLPQNGYRFCLKVYPNGKGVASTTHVSVFVHLMKGDFDHLLPWPMPLEIKLCLVDQIYGNVYTTTVYNYKSTGVNGRFVFDQPTTNRNAGFGELEFICLSDIFNNSRIYHDDSILLRCLCNA